MTSVHKALLLVMAAAAMTAPAFGQSKLDASPTTPGTSPYASPYAMPPLTTPSLTTPSLTLPDTDSNSRKGTRKFRSGDATPPVDTTAKGGLSSTEKLAQCMDTWDTGTHITKSKWKEICKRQLDAR